MNPTSTRNVSVVNRAGRSLERIGVSSNADARKLARGTRGWRVGALDLFVATVFLMGAGPATATIVTFDFDGMAYRASSSPGSNADVQGYMQTVWSGAGAPGDSTDLSVAGAGELSNNRYTGDDHVVGPYEICANGNSGNTRPCNFVPATLGSTEGGVQGAATVHPIATSGTDLDNYIVNNGSDRITVVFPVPIYFASFDYEIFPDGTCPNGTVASCDQTSDSNWPDFKFVADGLEIFRTFATLPGSTGTYCESQSSNLNNSACERAPQYLGVSGTWYFVGGVTTLEFVDWPRRIGIDNLVVDTCCEPRQPPQGDVPEPGSMALTGAALAGLAILRRRRDAVRT